MARIRLLPFLPSISRSYGQSSPHYVSLRQKTTSRRTSPSQFLTTDSMFFYLNLATLASHLDPCSNRFASYSPVRTLQRSVFSTWKRPRHPLFSPRPRRRTSYQPTNSIPLIADYQHPYKLFSVLNPKVGSDRKQLDALLTSVEKKNPGLTSG